MKRKLKKFKMAMLSAATGRLFKENKGAAGRSRKSRRASEGANDLTEAVRTAVINKRAGGMELITCRKAFQRPLPEGVEILNAVQDVYLGGEITIA